MRSASFKQIVFSIIALLFCFFTASADRLPVRISSEDESAVLQKSLDLAELQSYLPSNKQVRILQHPVVFSSNVVVTKFGLPVLFVDREATDGLDAYINFISFSVSGDTATANFIITYGRNSSNPGSVRVSVKLSKSAGNWNIIDSTINP
jgi:hypothetical protein